jgi:uncharacterized BrkB/YihY/UPF0761 family membrane protein
MQTYVIPLLTVLGVGLLLGAGLPAVFALGLVSYSNGAGAEDAEGHVHKKNPALEILGIAIFVLVSAVIVIAILRISRNTIIHTLNFDPFFGMKKA